MKLYKEIIITSDKTLLSWKTFNRKRQDILKELNSVKNGRFSLDFVYQDVVPLVIDGRITPEWMDSISHPLLDRGYDIVGFHFSEAQKKKWKVIPTSNGIHMRDEDLVGEFYFWADEKTLRNNTRLNQFIQTCLHENRHVIKYGTGEKDDTHEAHADGNIKGSFKDIDMTKYSQKDRQLEKKISFLQSVIDKLKAPQTLLHPVTDSRSFISQAYGVKSSLYKATGRHIGTDYAIPLGTRLIAPWDGEVTTAGTHPQLGNFCHFTYTFKGQMWEERWNHLLKVPALGVYKRGEAVALSGNTGLSTGPHLHREKWYNDVRTDLINSKNWNQLTIDPETIM